MVCQESFDLHDGFIGPIDISVSHQEKTQLILISGYPVDWRFDGSLDNVKGVYISSRYGSEFQGLPHNILITSVSQNGGELEYLQMIWNNKNGPAMKIIKGHFPNTPIHANRYSRAEKLVVR